MSKEYLKTDAEGDFEANHAHIGNEFQECCRPVADLLPIKLLMDNDVADVADFPTRNAIQCLIGTIQIEIGRRFRIT